MLRGVSNHHFQLNGPWGAEVTEMSHEQMKELFNVKSKADDGIPVPLVKPPIEELGDSVLDVSQD